MYSVAHTLDQLAPSISLALVAPAEHALLRAVAGSLPAQLTNWIYLECRLRSGAPRVDLIVRVDRRGRAVLTGNGRIVIPGATLHAHPIWRGVRALALEWSKPSSPLHRGVERIWLEFDIHASDEMRAGTDAGTMPAPGVFIEFASSVCARQCDDNALGVALAALRALMPDCCPASIVRNLRTCWEMLPSHASIPYVGLFPARGSCAVRVCVAGLGEADLARYLHSVRWPGSLDGLTRATAALLPPHLATRPRMAIVNLDVGRCLLAGVGIEYVMSREAQLRGVIAETAFIDGLVESGLSSLAKRDALLTWPGLATRVMRHELWCSRVVRRVNHVKLSYSPGEPPEVKGYLSASHEFQPTRNDPVHAPIGMQPSTR